MRAGRKDGWVLMETVVAMVLLSVGLLAINRAMRESIATRALARDYTVARFLLEEKMGELEIQTVHQDGASSAGDFGDDHPRFTYSWNVSRVDMPTPEVPPELQPFLVDVPELPEPYLGRISVTISWTRAGRDFSTTAETLVSSARLIVSDLPDDTAVPTS
ncbi:MAG TPA: hypothetical protein PK869_15275 [Candidatus Hydrogenedentes bacterium]|nr:hypothetical protein [Candidatus Hydrogenedentota bacterium]